MHTVVWKSRQKRDHTTVMFLRVIKQHFFRQINISTKEITKELISRKFLSVIAFYTGFFHTIV